MKLIARWTMISFILMTMSACNTIEGAGKDIKAGGEKIEDTAKDAK